MSGYTEIGEDASIAPGVTILNRVKIGRDAFVGIGSLVLHDVGEGEKVTGRPAVTLAKHKAERKALKKMLDLDPNTQRIATKKRLWQRIVKQVKIRVLPNR
jgi:serine acetyltransferase